VSCDTAVRSFVRYGRTEPTPIDHPTHAGNRTRGLWPASQLTVVSGDAIVRVDGYRLSTVCLKGAAPFNVSANGT
jgi:hypothetical protein